MERIYPISSGLSEAGVNFSENAGKWKRMPNWVDFSIRFGHFWPPATDPARRVAVMSMPCDSAAAGLVTLGAMIRAMANPKANDIDGHYDALLQYARQYLEACNLCDLAACAPDEKRCGYDAKVTGKVRDETGKKYIVSDRTDFETRQLAFTRNSVVSKPYPQFVTEWHIDGEPVPVSDVATGYLNPDVYKGFVGHAEIDPENLRSTYSGTCLAGRAGGEAPTREMYSNVRFCNAAGEFGLDELLSIHTWSAAEISRVTYFNSRSGRLDRGTLRPLLIIADGDVALLSVLGKKEFQGSDVIGVIHRTLERERLEAVGAKMQDLAQWYVADEDALCSSPALPRGISLSILRRMT